MTKDKIRRAMTAFKRHCAQVECDECRYELSSTCEVSYLTDVKKGFDLRKGFKKGLLNSLSDFSFKETEE